jgi:nanoRNase/pAp phosphatase (c-di-AMP/oligoRNAs hydrolase)
VSIGTAWRVVITDTESLTGVAPVCERATIGAGHHPAWVYDCCPFPQIETWSEATATQVAEIFTAAEATLAGA